jgi:hypothetical protein
MKKKISLAFLLFLLSFSGFAQEINYKMASLYVYNFTKYIDWPEAYKKKDAFVIGVLGNTPAFEELKKMASAKKMVLNKPAVVEKVNTIKEIEGCHILFIPEGQSARLKEIKALLKSSAVLIITEKPGMGQKGAGINLFLDDDDDYKLKFELNKASMEAQGLIISSQLMSLGVKVK